MGKKAEIGKQIRVMRKSRDMTQEDLARAIGQTGSSITMYETGRRSPNYETLEALADVFNVPISSFLSEDVIERPQIPIAVPDSERFVKLVHYMSQEDYLNVMKAFERAEQRMREAEGDAQREKTTS